MDRSTVTGLLIIGVLLLGYTWYNGRQLEKFRTEETRRDSIEQVLRAEEAEKRSRIIQEQSEEGLDEGQELIAEGISEEQEREDTTASIEAYFSRMLHDAKSGEEEFFTVENDVMIITFSNKGGKIANVELKDYKRFNGDPLKIMADNSANLDLNFYIQKSFHNTQINTSDYYFAFEEAPSSVVEGDVKPISLKLYFDKNSYVEFQYVIRKSEYMFDYQVRFNNMGEYLANQTDMTFTWDAIGPQQEKGFDNENNYSSVTYKFPGERKVQDLGRDKATKEKLVESRIQWVGFKQQFFSSIFIADQNFIDAGMRFDTYMPEDDFLKKFHGSMRVPFDLNTTEYGFQFYYGPNQFTELKQYEGLDLHRLIPLGPAVVSWINRLAVIPIFDFLSGRIASFGVIILILTILLRLVVFPFTYKSYLSGAKMRLIKPQVDKLNEKYPKEEDALKKQQEMMALYKRAGVNPMGGCLPMLVQMPIFIAMFRFFPSSIELRGQSFLWAEDLSAYDSIINLPFSIPMYGDHVSLFTLLMAVMIFVNGKLTMSQQGAGADAPGMGAMRIMSLYFMPLMLLVWFNNYASGLTYYYCLSTFIAIIQMVAFRYLVNDDKLKEKMVAEAAKKKAKPKKQSKWQKRYQEMVKQQEQLQKQQRKRR